MKQKPVLEMWPKPSINLRLFDFHGSPELMHIVLKKTDSEKKQQNYVIPARLVSPWNNVHRTKMEILYQWLIT